MTATHTADRKVIRPKGWSVDRRHRGTAILRWMRVIGINTASWPDRRKQRLTGLPLIDVYFESSKARWDEAQGRARENEAAAGPGRGAVTLRLNERAKTVDECVFVVPAPTMAMLLNCWWDQHGNRERTGEV